MIKENKLITDDLNFKPVSSDFVSKQINKLNVKKDDFGPPTFLSKT
jgi:hypothetical protein